MSSKPIILAIETSSESASVALLRDDVVSLRHADGVASHSLSVLPMVQAVLADAGLTLSDCDALAFGAGPGSFTGVRTACGVVQGLAFGADLPVVLVVTLLALAESARVDHGCVQVLCALDARMGEVYWAEYRYDGATACWVTVQEPALSAPGGVQPRQQQSAPALVGNGFAAYREQFALPADALDRAYHTVPQADAVARLARADWLAGHAMPAHAAQPIYLRNKVALTSAERLAAAR